LKLNGASAAKWASLLFVIAVVATTFAGAASSVLVGPAPSALDTTLRIGALQEPDSLNPNVGVLTASYVVWAHVYELLVAIGPDLTPVPGLASSWEVDAANLNWTFHLVQNATWHDSTPTTPRPFTAEDVNFTFRYIAPASAGNPIGCDLQLLQGYLGGVDVDNITVLDPYTILIPTTAPKANVLSMFIQILPEHIWSGIACNQAGRVRNDPPIGTGMYRFVTWVRGTYIQLDLNTAYWRLSPTEDYIDHILITYYRDSTSLYNAFTAGTIDATAELTSQQFAILPLRVAGSAVDNVIKFRVDAISLSEVGACVASDNLIAAYGKRGGRNWLLTNLTVRQALQHAVNRSALVQNVLNGLGRPGETLIPPATPFWHYELAPNERYDYNPDRARALLNDPKGDGATLRAGQTVPGDYGQNLDPTAPNNQDAFIDTTGDNVRDVVNAGEVVAGDRWGTSAPNANSLSFTLSLLNYDTEGRNAAGFERQWWAAVGILVTEAIVTESRMITITYDCNVDLYDWGWGGDVDPDFLLSVMTTDQILNWQDAWYSDAEYDQWYIDQQTQVNATQRQQTIFNMQRKLYRDAAYQINWYAFDLTVVRSDKFVGWGDWEAHPGLGLTGFGNDFVMLTLRDAAGQVTNQCPSVPVIEGTSPLSVYVNVSQTFTGSSADPESDPLRWTWSWGEGNTTIFDTPSGWTTNSTDFTWTVLGTYDVILTVDDARCGRLVSSPAFQVTVSPLPAQFGWIAGTVRDAATTQAVVGASVRVTPGGFADVTNATGAYNVTLAVGTYSVTASHPLYVSSTQASIIVASDLTTTVNFALQFSAGWIIGTVTASTGGAIAGATVLATDGTRTYPGQTNAAGEYNITVGAGTYSVEATAAGFRARNVTGITVASRQQVTQNFVLEPLVTPPAGVDILWVATGALIAVILVALVAVYLMRRKKKEEIAPPSIPPPPKPPGAP